MVVVQVSQILVHKRFVRTSCSLYSRSLEQFCCCVLTGPGLLRHRKGKLQGGKGWCYQCGVAYSGIHARAFALFSLVLVDKNQNLQCIHIM